MSGLATIACGHQASFAPGGRCVICEPQETTGESAAAGSPAAAGDETPTHTLAPAIGAEVSPVRASGATCDSGASVPTPSEVASTSSPSSLSLSLSVEAASEVLPAVDWSRVLTNSRLRTFRRCQREHHFAYELGIRPAAESEALRFGSLFHTALEAWLRAPDDAARLLHAFAAIEAEVHAGASAFDGAKARALMSGYHARWLEEALEVLAVEVSIPLSPIRNPDTGALSKTWLLGGKLDAIVRDLADGNIYILEHKTSSEDVSAGSDYWRRLRLDGQVSTYYEGADRLGYGRVAGCLYDVIAKPLQRPWKATPLEARKYAKKTGLLYADQRESDETPDQYETRLIEAIAADPNRFYARGTVVRLAAELEDAAGDTWDLGLAMRAAERSGRHPRNVDSCFRYGAPCPYWAACSGETSIENTLFYRQVEVIHPELAAVPAPSKEETNHADQPAGAA